MKRIDGDKVFISKGTIMKIRMGMGFALESSLVSTPMFIKITNGAIEKESFFYMGSENKFDFHEIIDEDAKEFVKNADWILDYDYYNNLSFDEFVSEMDKKYNEFESKLGEVHKKVDNLDDKGFVKVCKSYEPELDSMNFAIEELKDLYAKKLHEKEVLDFETSNVKEEIVNEENSIKEEISITKVKKRTLKDVFKKFTKKNN